MKAALEDKAELEERLTSSAALDDNSLRRALYEAVVCRRHRPLGLQAMLAFCERGLCEPLWAVGQENEGSQEQEQTEP